MNLDELNTQLNEANSFPEVENFEDLATGKIYLKTAIRLIVKKPQYQRYCLDCGKILPTEIKQNYRHICEKPDFSL
mgnify:CR=1 FL=1